MRLVDPLGRPTTYDYDELSRLVRVTDPLAHATTYRRDALGRVTGVLDAEGKPTSYSYDPVGRLLAVTDALGGATRYEYDEAGNLVGITDANSRTSRFTYNLLSQLTGEINPLGETWRYAYDPNGRLNRRVDAFGRESFYEYDSNDRLVGVQYGAPVREQAPLRFAYDLDGNETRMCDGLGCFAHSYDALGRLTATTDWLGRTVRRSYDGVGSMVELVYPNARPVRYEYDGANQLAGVTDARGGTSVYERDANGQVTRIRHPNATLTSYSYDEASRLATIDHRQDGAAEPQSAYAYTLDRMGNRTGVRETRAAFDGSDQLATIERGYGYDQLDRLTRASDNLGSDTAYSFDAVGNRLERSGAALTPDAGLLALPVRPAPVAERSTYNAANQLTQSGGVTLTYDANGNRRETTRTLPDGRSEVLDYSYDREDRLVGVERRIAGAVVMQAAYEYDGYGRRARKTVTYPGDSARNQRIIYLYDGLEIIGATVEKGGTTRELAFYLAPSPLTGLRRPYAMEDLGSGERYWFQADGLDSVVALTDEGGKLVAPLLYNEYGRHLAGESTLQLFTFTAQDHDPETGLLHFHARYYDPATGTWLTQDPYRGRIDTPMTLHRYGYVGGNPVTRVDEYGYWVQILVVAVLVVSEVVDYGWTAYDSWNAGKTIADPNASDEDKFLAATELTLSVGFEGLEPDEFVPVGLPADDIARKVALNQIKDAMDKHGIKGAVQKARELFGDKADQILRELGIHYGDNSVRCIRGALSELGTKGHTIRDHGPSLTSDQLKSQIYNGKDYATKFYSVEIMHSSIETTLKQKEDEILGWAEFANKGSKKEVDLDLGIPVGGGYAMLCLPTIRGLLVLTIFHEFA